MSEEQSQHEALLGICTDELCRYRGWNTEQRKKQASRIMGKYVDNFYEALALNNATQALHGPKNDE